MANQAEGLDLRVLKTITVKAPIQRAFTVFVEQMETWWPASHHVGDTPFQAIFVEQRVGGRWFERNVAGKEGDWGTVLRWDPPRAVCFSWHIGPGHDQSDWKFDPNMAKASEVEIRFTPLGPDSTFVELEHRKIERHGEGAEQLRNLLDGPGAWIAILDKYAHRVESAS